jgi:hypothetical protein
MDLIYPAGAPPRNPGPLARFLPPLEEGSVAHILDQHAGSVIFDPFGASPRLAIDAARAGRAVLVAANNPVTRFLLEHTAIPPLESDLRAALSRLGSASKDDSRLEPFLLELYLTECSTCSARVSADFFVWERETSRLELKGYHCPSCNHADVEPASDLDRERAQAYTRRGLQHALALEQVAPAGDPDREHAEAALAVYPARALYALVTLLNKLEQTDLDPRQRAATHALLLSTFDAGNSLWGYPEGRARPRALTAAPHYREVNIWRQMERSMAEWELPASGVGVRPWKEGVPLERGYVTVFPGPARDLMSALSHDPPDAVLTVPPRPNQAYWTLAALWAAWLWGRSEAAPIRVGLRRRRYDWAWHTAALRTSVASVFAALRRDTPVFVLVPEAEPGFTAAVLTAFDHAGLRLGGAVLRNAEGQLYMTGRLESASAIPLPAGEVGRRAAVVIESALEARNEPASFGLLHCTALEDLGKSRQLAAHAVSEDAAGPSPIAQAIEGALGDRSRFAHLGGGSEPESGSYWLARDRPIQDAPLADRVELLVAESLQRQGHATLVDIDRGVCAAFPGILTPDRRWVLACLRSYAEQAEDGEAWVLRTEDEVQSRLRDREELRTLLEELGLRLGHRVATEETQVIWEASLGGRVAAYQIQSTAALGPFVASSSPEVTIVIPGGRAALLGEKARRDPRMRGWLQAGTRLVKFRHIRRLASELTLRADAWRERLALDPMAEQDPQMPLL